LSKDLLKHLRVKAGDKVAIEKLPGGRIQLKANRDGKISDVFGLLKREGGPSLSIDEMSDVIASAWAGKR
jgi:hypothetical protein